MPLPLALSALRRRFGRPALWAVALLPTGFLGPLLIILRPADMPPSRPVLVLALLTAWWAGGVFFTPLAWQWNPRGPSLPSWGRGLLQSLALTLLWALAMVLLLEALRALRGHPWQTGHFLGMSLGLTGLSLPLHPLGFGLARAEALVEEIRETEARARTLEWVGRMGSFPPYLLFETLEALSEETPKDPRQAEAGLLDLAALFRQWLVQGQASRTRLRAERELLDRYLAVEQRRMGPHLRCRAQWTGEAEDLELPSMTLLALVRGCLEEARASSVGVDLRLEVRGQDEGLNARLICNGRLRSAEPPPATLAALRARLEAWEGGGSLELVQEGSHFEALLRVGGAPHAMA